MESALPIYPAHDHELRLENTAMAALLALARGDVEAARTFHTERRRVIEARWSNNDERKAAEWTSRFAA